MADQAPAKNMVRVRTTLPVVPIVWPGPGPSADDAASSPSQPDSNTTTSGPETTTTTTTAAAAAVPPLRPIATARLLFRPIAACDLPGYAVLRRQPAVMKNTSQGRVDASMAETEERLAPNLPPHAGDRLNCSILLKGEGGEGEEAQREGDFIGVGGIVRARSGLLGWPEVGYMIVQERWGRGLASEFLAAYLAAWWALPRTEVELDVDRDTVGEGVRDGDQVPERLVAVTEKSNAASARVLAKAGFETCKVFQEPDLRDPEVMATLYAHRLVRGA